MTATTYAIWFAAVDAIVQRMIGLSAADLPDAPYRDWYEDGETPRQAAKAAIRLAHDE